jgi:RecB family exonuclease
VLQSVIGVIKSHAADNAVVFVFPSEVAARYWRYKVLDITGLDAVRGDRIVSWDTFKERALPGTEERRPVNSVLRTIFTHDFLRKNKKDPKLAYFVRPEYAETGEVFSRTIRTLLPGLKTLREALHAGGAGEEPELFSDILYLHRTYLDFLEARNLYEPNFEVPAKITFERRAFIFFPEVIEDFEDLRPALESTGLVDCVSPRGGGAVVLREYENSYQEIRALLVRLAALIDSGVDTDDILVTFPEIDLYGDYFSEQARLHGIPVIIRQGRSVGACPGGSLFEAIGSATASGFHAEDLKRLLLDAAFPWREPRLCRDLVRHGMDNSCFGTYETPSGRKDPWRDAFRGTGRDDLREFHSRLTSSLRAIRGSPDALSLRTAVQSFAARFFDDRLWREENLKVFQFALGTLADLVRIEGDGGPKTEGSKTGGLKIEEPFALFLDLLRDRVYVPRNTGGGIDVYPYRVAAGAMPAHHFIANCSQDSTLCGFSPFSPLREDLRERLGLRDRDFSEVFLSLYSVSGGEVSFSYARDSRSGVRLPPGYFVARDLVRKAGEIEGDRKKDPMIRETSYWAGAQRPGSGPFPSGGPLGFQARGLAGLAATAFTPRGVDCTARALPGGDLVSRLLERASENGRPVFTATGIEVFADCPFRYLGEKILALEEAPGEREYEDPRAAGTLLHDVFRDLFRRIKETNGRFLSEKIDIYLDWAKEARDAIFLHPRRGGFVPPGPVLTAWFEGAAEDAAIFLEREADRYDGYPVEAVEASYSAEVEEAGALLKGRIDRVSRNPGRQGLLVVDYKRGKPPMRKTVTGEAKVPPSFQIPSYVYLLEKAGGTVEEASYYSASEGKYSVVYGESEDAWLDRRKLSETVDKLTAALGAAAARIRAGDYRAESEDCSHCGFRALCRTKYKVR